MAYDSWNDTRQHQFKVRTFLGQAIRNLFDRAIVHDDSKLHPPEKEIFDVIKPEMKEVEAQYGYGSDEWQKQYDRVQELLEKHYKVNDHHPQHFQNGVDGMSLMAVLEMVADWKAAASAYGHDINLEHVFHRFKIDPQLQSIIRATLTELKW